jgi:CheY-like chemotaxis protein
MFSAVSGLPPISSTGRGAQAGRLMTPFAAAVSSPPASTPPVGILVVDDHPEYLACATAFLAHLPRVRVLGTAVNGREALQQVRNLAPDLVLLDLSMPVMDGLTAARLIKGRPHAPVVVIVTVEATLACSLAVAAAGADALVAKAEVPEQLPALLEKLFPAL